MTKFSEDNDKLLGYHQGKDIGQMQSDIKTLQQEIKDIKDTKRNNISLFISIICCIATIISAYFTYKASTPQTNQTVIFEKSNSQSTK